MPLSSSKIAVLQTASAEAINSSTARALKHISKGQWLALRNRYRVATIKSIEDDHHNQSLNSRQLAEYIAVSAPLHCCDGWAFLGRAVGCLLHGDPDSARHLAYYAELRATIALLATQGVGIFNSRHFVINKSGSAALLTKAKTHTAAWEVLEAWSELPAASNFLGEILRPAGQPISQWVTSMPNGASWQPIATDWLLKLGLDLQRLSLDRDTRNEASYRPTHLNRRVSLTAMEAAASAHEIWSLLEPAPPLPFGEIDRYLLRLTLETAFQATEGVSVLRARTKFSSAVAEMVAVNVASADATLWEEFLSRSIDPTDPGIIDRVRFRPKATKNFSASMEVRRTDHHLSMMARALLLLRVASGATRQMLVNGGVNFDDLAFWWRPYGTDRGLWIHPPPAAHITDVWADTESSLLDIDEWLKRGAPDSWRGLLSEVPASLTGLTSLEMVGLWSLAS